MKSLRTRRPCLQSPSLKRVVPQLRLTKPGPSLLLGSSGSAPTIGTRLSPTATTAQSFYSGSQMEHRHFFDACSQRDLSRLAGLGQSADAVGALSAKPWHPRLSRTVRAKSVAKTSCRPLPAEPPTALSRSFNEHNGYILPFLGASLHHYQTSGWHLACRGTARCVGCTQPRHPCNRDLRRKHR